MPAQIEATHTVTSATSGVHSTTLTVEETATQLAALNTDLLEFQRSAKRLRQQGHHEDARHAEDDAAMVSKEIARLEARRQHERSWVAASAALELDTVLLGIAGGEGNKASQVQTLSRAISSAVKSLHEMGGRLPAERTAQKLQTELHAAQARVRELEERLRNRPHRHDSMDTFEVQASRRDEDSRQEEDRREHDRDRDAGDEVEG